jgi:hypothetical protein
MNNFEDKVTGLLKIDFLNSDQIVCTYSFLTFFVVISI